jgi:hypothetical protein
MEGLGNRVGDIIICACASFVCQTLLLTSQFSLLPATAFLEVSTLFSVMEWSKDVVLKLIEGIIIIN